MFYLTRNDKEYSIEFSKKSLQGKINTTLFSLDFLEQKKNSFTLVLNNKSYRAFLVGFNIKKKTISLFLNGSLFNFFIKNKEDFILKNITSDNSAPIKSDTLISPMPGLVSEVLVKENQKITISEPLIILEAMKMENVLKCYSTSVVKKILVQNGSRVEKDQPLILFK